jgi:hypothetical protein
MSIVFWLKSEADPDDFAPDDLAGLSDRIDEIDEICRRHHVKPLGEFVDDSDLEFNMSEEELDEDWLRQNAKWVSAAELLDTLNALAAALDEAGDDQDLAEEISYAAHRCGEAEKAGLRVRLIAVM